MSASNPRPGNHRMNKIADSGLIVPGSAVPSGPPAAEAVVLKGPDDKNDLSQRPGVSMTISKVRYFKFCVYFLFIH